MAPVNSATDCAPRDTVVRRFFRRAFAIFIAFAIALTLVLIGETLWLARDTLKIELTIYQRTFEKSLASALWSMDREKLESIVQGIVEIPDIVGVKLTDPASGDVIIQSGTIPTAADSGGFPLVHRFDVIQDEGFGKERVARAEFHSSLARLLGRTQGQIILIVVLAALKTLVFWLVFLAVGKRLVTRPLTEMTHSIASARSAHRLQLGEATEKAISNTELALLRDAYDSIADRMQVAQEELARANEHLEKRVEERTRELQEASIKLETLALTDSLTGLANRRQFIAVAELEIARAQRNERPLSLIVCDIDSFKEVNDVYGHLAGDQAICHVATQLRESVRQIDVVGRFGGDEFVILLPEVGLEVTRAAAERLREQLSTTPLVLDDGRQVIVTLSIGLATLEAQEKRLDDLFHRADTALYAAKSGGRNCVRG